MMWRWGYGDPGAWGIVGLVVMAIFWILVITLIVLGIRWLIRAGGGPSGGPGAGSSRRPDDPLEILRQRYARGEIDDEEYERRRKLLSGG
jgi:putative membrane protein